MNKFLKAILALVVVWLLLYGVSVLYANGGSGKGKKKDDGNKTDGNKTSSSSGSTGLSGGGVASSYYPVKYGSRDGTYYEPARQKNVNHIAVRNLQLMANTVNNQLWAAGVKNELGGKRQIKVDGIWGPDTEKAAKMLHTYYVWRNNQKDYCWRRGLTLRDGGYMIPTLVGEEDMVNHHNGLYHSGLINEATLLKW